MDTYDTAEDIKQRLDELSLVMQDTAFERKDNHNNYY